MKIQVILYGTLRKNVADHDSAKGFPVELPDGSSVEGLIDQLEIPRTELGTVSVNGILVKEDATLSDLDTVRIYQPIFGG